MVARSRTAGRLANHESLVTTMLYDHTSDTRPLVGPRLASGHPQRHELVSREWEMVQVRFRASINGGEDKK